MKYRVYYSDGSTHDSGDPYDTPIWGVLAIVELSKRHGRRVVSGGDYYVWSGTRWMSVDGIGMVQYLAKLGARAVRVLVGEMVDEELWQDTMRMANTDPDFPERTAYDPYEYRTD